MGKRAEIVDLSAETQESELCIRQKYDEKHDRKAGHVLGAT